MSELFAWIPWFRELARKISDGGPKYLAERSRAIRWNIEGEAALVQYGDRNIDPFSFFRFLSSKNTARWRHIHPQITRHFGLTTGSGTDFDGGFYFPTGQRQPLFHNSGSGDPDLFWRLFRDAIRGPASVSRADFDTAMGMDGVAITKLSQTLFLINPTQFLPFDEQSLFPLRAELRSVETWNTYRRELEVVRRMFPGCEPYEIQHLAYAVFGRKELDLSAGTVWQSGTNVEGKNGPDDWDDFRKNGWIHHDRELFVDLCQPAPGDLVFVHKGLYEGRGIGVVHRNDYEEEWSPDQRLHVLWLNAASAKLSELAIGKRFSRGVAMKGIFRDTPEYAPTFDLLTRLGWKEDGGHRHHESRDSGKNRGPTQPLDFQVLEDDTQIPKAALREIWELLEEKKQIIFQGPPGTGKTYLARKLAACLAGTPDRVQLVQFHPSYSYEDFVEGYRPTLEAGQASFKLRDGPLREMARRAKRDRDAKHFLVIDEINRGNLPKILGELYFLLEYRDEEMRLQYSSESFSLPDNLYLIGTMNTADRSIALLDLALRRRFSFVEFHPDKPPINALLRKWLTKHRLEEFLKLERVLQEANKELADRHASIGPTYFMPKDRKLDDKRVRRIWDHNVMPYIEERLFDQEDRLEDFSLDRLLKRVKEQSRPTDEAQQDASEAAESNNDGD